MNRSLANKKVLITRAINGAQTFAKQLEMRGAKPIIVPLRTILCRSYNIEKPIHQYRWVFFTSANAVHCFCQNERYTKQLAYCHIAVVGDKTKKAVEQYGLHVHFMPTVFNAETMAHQFHTKIGTKEAILFVRGNMTTGTLEQFFTTYNYHVDQVIVYENKPNEQAKQNLLQQTSNYLFDFITFTSPSTVETFMNFHPYYKKTVPIICIGTTTAKKAKQLGFHPVYSANPFTLEGMIQTMEAICIKEEKGNESISTSSSFTASPDDSFIRSRNDINDG